MLPPAHEGSPVDAKLARSDAGSDECGHSLRRSHTNAAYTAEMPDEEVEDP